MNEQEQAIAKIQQTLDYCIQQTLRSLEDTIERKAEVLPVNELTEVERSEYTHALDELAVIYSKFPAVASTTYQLISFWLLAFEALGISIISSSSISYSFLNEKIN